MKSSTNTNNNKIMDDSVDYMKFFAKSSFDEIKSASTKYEIKELKLESGRKAFCYSPASDAENLYIIIDAKDVIPSGKGVINCYIGAKASWTYTEEKLANIIDKGFSAPK